MKVCLPLLCFVLLHSLSAQEESYPEATPTDQPDVVISPYDATRRLDVAGLEPGSLAEDPVAKKIFRIPSVKSPLPNNVGLPGGKTNSNESILPPPIERTEPPRPSVSNSPVGGVGQGQLPPDLLNFLYAFNQNSTVNDPDALGLFYADTVANYFGQKNVNRATIRNDRASYINRYPQRQYVLDGPPVLLGQNGDIYEVMTRVGYAVSGNGRARTGAVTDYFKIRKGKRQFEIVSIEEAKASAAPIDILEQELDRRGDTERLVISPAGQESVYSRFEVDQINLFLNAFAASGEINEPSAMIEFMDPRISTYYTLRNPDASDLINNRRDYIRQWPERRYWVVAKPAITPLSGGGWNVVMQTGYEVKNGSKISNGLATSDLQLSYTLSGLKILSVTSRNQSGGGGN